MRAEIQNAVAEIEKSLDLLAQRMDWETASHRLEEFNARVEDPNLWDDPDAAQKLMRDRQMLVDAMETYSSIKQDMRVTRSVSAFSRTARLTKPTQKLFSNEATRAR